MEVIYLSPGELIPYEKNAKQHPPEQVRHIANSIKQFGWQQPIVVDRENVVIIGHGRLMAAKELNLDSVPVVYADNLTDDQVNALRLADNKTNESPWDFGKLEEELAALSIAGIDMTAFGFDDLSEIGGATSEITEDEPPEVPEEPKAKRGEIYRLGNHRLICGDSTDVAVIDRLMDGEKADMVFTDPPYNANYKSRGNDAVLKKGIKNDNMDDEAFTHFIEKFMEQIQRNIKKGGSIYICCNWKDSYPRMYFECIKRNFNVSNCIVWNKKSAGMGWQDYRYQFELIIYGFDMGKGHNFYGDRTQTDIWECSREARQNYVHPTQKPVEIPAKAIKNSSLKDDKVLDLFGGSGTTLIACEQLNRKCFMAELDPHYCDVIIQRWENLTKRKAVLIHDPE